MQYFIVLNLLLAAEFINMMTNKVFRMKFSEITKALIHA